MFFKTPRHLINAESCSSHHVVLIRMRKLKACFIPVQWYAFNLVIQNTRGKASWRVKEEREFTPLA